jgi:hypothetical protein
VSSLIVLILHEGEMSEQGTELQTVASQNDVVASIPAVQVTSTAEQLVEDPISGEDDSNQIKPPKDEDKNADLPKVSMTEMFQFAEAREWFLMISGLIGSMGGGTILPLFAVSCPIRMKTMLTT